MMLLLKVIQLRICRYLTEWSFEIYLLISLDPKFRGTAKDLRLFCIGKFDVISGEITPIQRRLVIDLKELVKED